MADPEMNETSLVDTFGRRVTYLRVSVTDRCDFRCVYCMGESPTFLPRARILTLEEIADVCRHFCALGVHKIRITGGEPLVRKNIMWLMEELGRMTGLNELTLTTNGSQLSRYARPLKDAGVRRLNISLDSLNAERFYKLTRVDQLDRVLSGIDAALAADFDRVKLNSVILKNRNHDEVNDLVQFAVARGLDISFIEEMPLGVITDHERAETFYSSSDIRRDLAANFTLTPTTESSGGPSRYFRVAGTDTRVGFISPHSHNFCSQCNRVRLTAEGRLLLCLGQEHSIDLKRVIRTHPGNSAALTQAIVGSMALKPKGHDFMVRSQPVILRHMNSTGG